MAYRAPTDRTTEQLQPPQSLDAEQAVLGSIIKDSEAVNQAIELLEEEKHFYAPKHQIIYKAILSLYERSEPCDITTLTDELVIAGQLEKVGGRVYLVELAESVASTANIAAYCKLVLEKSMLRRMIQTSNEIVRSCYNQDQPVGVLLDSAEENIFRISQGRLRQGFVHVKDLAHTTVQMIEDIQHDRSGYGIKTGFHELDVITNGLQNSDLIIIAGRPSMGKTSLAMCIAEQAAINKSKSIGIFSIEMSREALVLRMLSSRARVNQRRIRGEKLSDEEWGKLTRAAGSISEANIYIDDSATLSPLEMRAKSRRLKAQHDVDLIIVDYIQMMHSSGGSENRQQEVALISRNLKSLAKELNIPVIAISQLSRAAEQRESKRPQLSDLRESGAIEQDADLVMFVYREEFYMTREQHQEDEAKGPAERKSGKAQIIIAKQRNGEVGTVDLAFIKEFTRFENLAAAYREVPSDADPVGGDNAPF